MNMPGCPARCSAGRRSTSLAVHAQCGIRISDSQCGLRVYPLEIVHSVRCFATRYSFEAEIIARAVWAGYEVISVPVTCRYLGKKDHVSHYRPWMDTLRQGAVHMRLLLRAAIPLAHRRVVKIDRGPALTFRKQSSMFLQWINPMRSVRETRNAQSGRLELAIALAIGVWIGVSPFYGLHILLCMYFAWRLHLHPAPMVLGTQVSTPPIGVLLAVLSTTIGHFVLTGHGLPTDHPMLGWMEWPTFACQWLSAWLLGSLILGGVLAVTVFWMTLLLGSWRSAQRVENVAISTPNQFIQADHADATIAQGTDHVG
jgi:uncharacterized protein (DUF2062 family)